MAEKEVRLTEEGLRLTTRFEKALAADIAALAAGLPLTPWPASLVEDAARLAQVAEELQAVRLQRAAEEQ